jgi:hypothetical protein
MDAHEKETCKNEEVSGAWETISAWLNGRSTESVRADNRVTRLLRDEENLREQTDVTATLGAARQLNTSIDCAVNDVMAPVIAERFHAAHDSSSPALVTSSDRRHLGFINGEGLRPYVEQYVQQLANAQEGVFNAGSSEEKLDAYGQLYAVGRNRQYPLHIPDADLPGRMRDATPGREPLVRFYSGQLFELSQAAQEDLAQTEWLVRMPNAARQSEEMSQQLLRGGRLDEIRRPLLDVMHEAQQQRLNPQHFVSMINQHLAQADGAGKTYSLEAESVRMERSDAPHVRLRLLQSNKTNQTSLADEIIMPW